MKAGELRIGNYVNTPYGIKRVSTVSVDGWSMHTESWEIPITEEWLLNFGFEKVRYEKYAHTKLKKLRAYPHVMKDGFGIYLMGSYTLPNIKYVHQLQNLYFALTGKELILNKRFERP